jgi:hypothetical protein
LVSGTPDADYIKKIPVGLEQYVEYVQPLNADELDIWRKSMQYQPVVDFLKPEQEPDTKEAKEEHDEQAALVWARIVHITGSLPRELVLLADEVRKLCNTRKRKRPESALATRVEQLFGAFTLGRKNAWQMRIEDKAGSGKVFEEGMLKVLDTMFMRPGADCIHNPDAMKVGPLFQDLNGTVRPTTPITSDLLYALWMTAVNAGKRPEWGETVVGALATLKTKGSVKRGYALEELLLHHFPFKKLTLFHYHDIEGNDARQVGLTVDRLQLIPVHQPPQHWRLVQPHTLVYHPGKGEERVDLIVYNDNTVYFLELTVGDYRKTKLVDPVIIVACTIFSCRCASFKLTLFILCRIGFARLSARGSAKTTSTSASRMDV